MAKTISRIYAFSFTDGTHEVISATSASQAITKLSLLAAGKVIQTACHRTEGRYAGIIHLDELVGRTVPEKAKREVSKESPMEFAFVGAIDAASKLNQNH